MDLERALETQRVALLRLLSGWFAVVEFASGGPLGMVFPHALPRCIRAFFSTLLTRAEFAALCLVDVSIRLQGGTSVAVSEDEARPPVACTTDEAPSFEALLRRMIALRDLLENLPHYARQKMRRPCRGRAAACAEQKDSVRLKWTRIFGTSDTMAVHQCILPRMDRPPDKSGVPEICVARHNSLPKPGREANVLAPT